MSLPDVFVLPADNGRLPNQYEDKSMLFFGWVAFAFLTAIAANSKNRSAVAGFILGALLPIIGLIGYLVAKPSPSKKGSIRKGLLVNVHGERQCPHCAELIKMQANKCKFCAASVEPITEAQAEAARASVYEPLKQKRTLIVCVIGIAVVAASYVFQS
jgi:hypothetical protein